MAISGGGGEHVLLGLNHLIFGQALDKIFGQKTSLPPPPPKKKKKKKKRLILYAYGHDGVAYLGECMHVFCFRIASNQNIMLAGDMKYCEYKLVLIWSWASIRPRPWGGHFYNRSGASLESRASPKKAPPPQLTPMDLMMANDGMLAWKRTCMTLNWILL